MGQDGPDRSRKASEGRKRAAGTETDAQARFRLISEIYQQLAADLAWLPIAEYRTQWGAADNVDGFAWYPDNSLRFYDLRVRE